MVFEYENASLIFSDRLSYANMITDQTLCGGESV